MRIVVDGLPYPIVVSTTGASEAAEILSRGSARAFLATDKAVADRARLVAQALAAAGCEVCGEHVMAAGERHKRWASVAVLHERMLEVGAERDCVLVAVGGGSLTDVAGFAAATYLRGVRWLPVATTPLGMVDAAIGGKTAVNLPQGKNLIGAMWHPMAVIADLAALSTVPKLSLRDGIAEIVKAAIALDPSLLERVERSSADMDVAAWAPLVAAAASVKVRIVASDPNDRAGRAALNLGHTFAHAFEQASRFRLAHGAAVALGLRSAGMLARNRTAWSQPEQRRVTDALRRFGLKVRLLGLSSDAIIAAMRMDKKRSGGASRFVLPVRLGEVASGVEVSDDEVRGVLDELSKAPLRRGW